MRILDSSEDVEIYQEEDSKIVFEKILSKDDLTEALQNAILPSKQKSTKIDLIDEYDCNTLYIEESRNQKTIYYNFKEQMIKCQYEEKGYNIHHPNSIFIVYVDENQLRTIKAFCYKNYKGKDTQLFKYPFANMLGQDSMCLGTIDHTYTNPLTTILNAIEANYTHSYTSFDYEGLEKTKDMFEYLSNNPFPYHHLKKSKCCLGDIIDKKVQADIYDWD